jgi:large subunit ribosomal protein L22
METTHIQKFIHATPRKLRLVADMARKMKPDEALNVLTFTHKSAALDLQKAIKVALANASSKGLVEVSFKSIEINEGPKMRRFQAGTRGRVKPFKRRMAHIKIVLTDELNVKSKLSPVKAELPKTEAKVENVKTEEKAAKSKKESK